ncbi:MAG: undecaprenyl-diphosphatase UppP [Chloroflexi bacterium]|nr:undecaprenyl-diphosphatase UppP [Chloroflexota bacterium]
MTADSTWLTMLQAVVLGVLQGATEFIPVSSSGHLVLAPWLLGWEPLGMLFDTMVHWGTLSALLVIFWRDLWEIATGWLKAVWARDWSSPKARLGWFLILGSIPGAVLGALFEDFFEGLFSSPGAVAALLLVTGLILALAERRGEGDQGMGHLKAPQVLLIGLAQAAAIAPGISRSGATISAGMGLGLRRGQAARFSFLLSIPIILGAGVLQLLSAPAGADLAAGLPAMAVGFVAAACSGYVVVRFLLRYLQRGSLFPFAVYCWVVGLGVLAAMALGL